MFPNVAAQLIYLGHGIGCQLGYAGYQLRESVAVLKMCCSTPECPIKCPSSSPATNTKILFLTRWQLCANESDIPLLQNRQDSSRHNNHRKSNYMYATGQETQTAANVFRELPNTQRMSVAPMAAEVTLL